MSTWTSTASVPYTLHVNVGVLSSSTGAVY
jgi:hypothetical protein